MPPPIRCGITYSTVSIPKDENTRVLAFCGTDISNFPSRSVETPTPFTSLTTTPAPGKGLPSLSVTEPRKILICAWHGHEMKIHKTIYMSNTGLFICGEVTCLIFALRKNYLSQSYKKYQKVPLLIIRKSHLTLLSDWSRIICAAVSPICRKSVDTDVRPFRMISLMGESL